MRPNRASLLALILAVFSCLISIPAAAQHGGGCACGKNNSIPANWELEFTSGSVWLPAATAEFAKWNTYANVFGSLPAGDLLVSKNNGKNELMFLTKAQALSAYGFSIDENTFGITWLSPNSSFGSPSFNACPPPAGTTCGTFSETDVIVNAEFSNGWTTVGPPDFNDSSGPAYFGATVLHELGHAIGLHHNFSNLSTMNYFEDYAAWYCTLADASTLRAHYTSQTRTVTDMAAYPFRHNGGYQYGAAVITSATPSSIDPGKTITIKDFSLENIGTSTANNVQLAFYLLADTTVTTSDTLLGTLVWTSFGSNSYWDGTSWDFVVPATVPPGTYYLGGIVTVGGSEDAVTYNNRWILDSGRRVTVNCTDPYEPNNSSLQGYGPISTATTYQGKICDSADVDWFKLNLTAGQVLAISLGVPAGADFDLELYDTSGNFRKGSYNGFGQTERIDDTVPVTGTYYARVYGFQGSSSVQNFYALSYTATSVPACTSFTLGSTSASPSSLAGSQPVTISGSPGGCQGGNWSASGNGSWLTVSPSSGSGSGSATVSWSQNPSTSSRFGNAMIASNTFSVTQSGTAPPACTSFTIDPSSSSPSSAAGSQPVTISGSPSGCQGGTWNASGNGSWLTVSPSNGSGSGSTTVSWSQNLLTSSRSDHATIASNTFSVTQSASGSGGGAPHSFIDVTGAAVQVHDLAVGPDGSVYVLFPTFSPTALSVVKSTDGGTSWSSPVSIPNSAFSNYEYHLVVDSGGTIHVVWWLSSANGTETYYSRSSNGGASFSSPIQVRTGNSYNGYRTNNATEPVVASDGAGNVYVAYGAYTKDGGGNFVGYNIWVSQSTNGGASFQPEFSINTISSAQKFPRRIRATASNFYVLYMDETSNDLYFYRRNVGAASGNTGRLNANLGSVQYDGDFAVGPSEMTFYGTYSDTTGDSEGNITFCKSTDGGITWPSCVRVNDSSSRRQDSPRVGLDSQGRLHMAWADGRSNGTSQIYYASSIDGGATFASNVNLSSPVTQTDFTQPHIVIDDPSATLYVSATRNYSQVVVARLSTTPTVPPPPSPTGVTAGAITSTRVDVTWNAIAGATYQIDRQAAGGGFSQIGTPATNSFSDTTVSADSSYLYRVRAVNSGGPSASSAADLATTVVFIDNPLTAGTLVKAVHLSQLRTAVNAVRLLAGLTPGSFTGAAASGTLIGAIHITELRASLDAARGTLGLSTGGYTNPSLIGVAIKAIHSQELRDRVK